MKKNLLVVVTLLMICCLLPTYSLASDSTKVVVITHYQRVNVRSGPSSSYNSVGSAKPDDVYPYLGSQNGWHCIQYTPYQTGYVYGELSEVRSAETSFETVVTEGWVHITRSVPVNVRTGPGTNYSAIFSAKPGECYPYVGTYSGWHCIYLDDGHVGYVASNLTTLEQDTWGIDSIAGSTSSNSSFSGSSRTVCPSCNGSKQCQYCDDNEFGLIKFKCIFCKDSRECQDCSGHGYR